MLESGGYDNYKGFTLLDSEWPTIAAAIPLFLQGENKRLQFLCRKLENFMNFYGRWDERLFLCLQAEECAVNANDANSAGWRSYRAGYTYYLRGMASEALSCACRAESYWRKSSAREKGFAIRLRGKINLLEKDYTAAMSACQEVLTIRRAIKAESTDVAIALNDLAEVERLSGDYPGAELHYREALRIARLVGFREGIATYTGNLAELALEHRDWLAAESLAREALALAEKVGRQESIASDCSRLARSLSKQGRSLEGLPYAQRAVEIYTKLRHRDLVEAQAVLKECEEAAADKSG